MKYSMSLEELLSLSHPVFLQRWPELSGKTVNITIVTFNDQKATPYITIETND